MKKWVCMLFSFLLVLLTFSACKNEPYTYRSLYGPDEYLLTVDPLNCTISDGANIYHYDISDHSNGVTINYPNGSIYWRVQDKQGNVTRRWSAEYDSDLYLDGFILEGALDQLLTTPYQLKNTVLVLLSLVSGSVTFLLLFILRSRKQK